MEGMTTISPSAAASREASRSTDGRFGTQARTEAEFDLDTAVPAGALDSHELPYALGVDESVTPKLKKLKNDRNGDPVRAASGPGILYTGDVTQTLPATKQRFGFRLQLSGGTEESPLLYRNTRGFNPVEVTGGHAVVHADSSFGNPVHVRHGATAHVIVDESDTKVSIEVDSGARVVLHIPADAEPGTADRTTIRAAEGAMVTFADHGVSVTSHLGGPGAVTALQRP